MHCRTLECFHLVTRFATTRIIPYKIPYRFSHRFLWPCSQVWPCQGWQVWLNPFRLSYVYIRTKFPNRCDSCTYIYVHGLCDQNMGLLTDTLRYHHTVHTRCSRASGLQLEPFYSMFTNGRKVEFTRSCPLFLASFGKLRLSDQVQFIAWYGIQRRIIWIFCRESEVSG